MGCSKTWKKSSQSGQIWLRVLAIFWGFWISWLPRRVIIRIPTYFDKLNLWNIGREGTSFPRRGHGQRHSNHQVFLLYTQSKNMLILNIKTLSWDDFKNYAGKGNCSDQHRRSGWGNACQIVFWSSDLLVGWPMIRFDQMREELLRLIWHCTLLRF